MTDIRRTVLWVVFTMSLVLLWDGWQKHNGQPSLFSPGAPRPAAVASQPLQPAVAGTTPAPMAAASSVVAAVNAPSEKIVVHTDVLTVTVDTLGGDVVRAELPKYLTAPDPTVTDQLMQMVGLQKKPAFTPEPVVLFDAANSYRAQTGLVNAQGGALPSHTTPMVAVPGERELAAGQNEVKLRLESAEVGGVKLVKTFTFTRGAYTVGVTHEVVNAGTAPVTPQVYLQLVRDGSHVAGGAGFTPTFTGPALYTEKTHFQKIEFKDIDKRAADNREVDIEKRANDGWVAMVQHYFASAWLENDNQAREFFVRKLPGRPGVSADTYATGMVFTLPVLAPGASESHQATLFAGPQEENKLATLAPGLPLVKDYGWLRILAEPLFWLLDKLHGFIGNWGWSIIGLVVLLKIAFYWLNASAYRSMAKMKAVAPRITELRERLKDKPQEMQQEMMKIYREEKVNPVGGCLPIFLQMPFFIALYWVLLSTVEMRQAPWLGWITDLSVRDPYFILPLLMMASSLLQVKLNPPAADPMQQKMMWIMPVVFGIMFFVFPSGLVLYWLTNNILSIAQQWLINKRLGVK
ncbi:MAG: membrane protein insertase YidC [Roseateles depolymerans]|uniref:Membrane protein insertase YidC n=1 Tax=Roseateles depolymerans TaxID=76731 RepID=A0A2W5DNR3_9BURK|nr:MAG: membrane protein insertase YidC [Roseateles depolymerans]